jgi:hypothetical protein
MRRICATSEFLDVGFDAHSMSLKTLAWYLAASKRRLEVFGDSMRNLGYTTELTQFRYRGQKGLNCLAFSGSTVEPGSVLFVAHHDYCAGVGAEDNATALATMVEVGRIFAGSTKVCFASFDLEEPGCEGSKAFVSSLTDEEFGRFELVIDLECLGSGKDVIICEQVSGAISDPALVSVMRRAARKAGYEFPVRSYDCFFADHVPFASRGAKTVEIGSGDADSTLSMANLAIEKARVLRGERRSDGCVAHTRFDVPESIKADNLQKSGEALTEFLQMFIIKDRVLTQVEI